MQMIYSLLWGAIFILTSLPAFAWRVTLQPNEADDTTAQVVVSNENNLSNVDVYLAWFDQDATSTEQSMLSWTLAQGWQSGLIPIFPEPTDLPAFESYTIDIENQTCPENHRCFLAFVATLPEQSPVITEFRQVASFLPLSLSAGCERLQGQEFFLSCNGSVNRNLNLFDGGDLVTTAEDEAAKAPTADSQETEKPDIFKHVGNKLLYANGQAQRFQVIDVSDFSNPRLESEIALSGNPRELYVLGDYYVLLQTHYVGENGTYLTVLNQSSEGTLTIVHEMKLAGWFIESRRRGELIYSVTQDFTPPENTLDDVYDRINAQVLDITALRLSEAGQLEKVDGTQLSGYSPTVAIFPDTLVIANHNPEEEKWQTTQIQAFDLSQPEKALVALPTLKVPGQVPSEFHLSVTNQQLRVVYGPEDREHGSTLAIYDLTSPEMALIGKVDEIAPGEALFATRFVDNSAFVVTFERKDPLWVIDLSDATAPTIVGELHVPGWSEKLFFHEYRLFAVGIDDQPTENEEELFGVSRVALSLFDVKDPTKPTLINRFTPLVGETSHSWSPALNDERALLLNWEEDFAALPINASNIQSGNHLQIVSLANDKIEDAGRLDNWLSIQRTLSLAPNVLAALGDQALLTLRWGEDQPELLKELELATNLTWLNWQDGQLWAAAQGNHGRLHRFYHYTPDDLEIPVKRWSLPVGYEGVKMDKNLVVFYDYYRSLTVQVLDVNTGELGAAQVLEEPPANSSEKEEMVLDTKVNWWHYRSEPLVHEGWFYVPEQRVFQPAQREQTAHLLMPETDYWQMEWILRSWNVTLENLPEAQSFPIPGSPLAFTANGELITREATNDGLLRLNLLALDAGNANLLHSQDLPCNSYSQVVWASDAVYVHCENEIDWPRLLPMKDAGGEDRAGDEGSVDKENVDIELVEPIEPPKLTTQLLRLNPSKGFTEEGNWTLENYRTLYAASGEVVLLTGYDWSGSGVAESGVDVATVEPKVRSIAATRLPNYQKLCEVYQLRPDNDPILLKQLEDCSYYSGGKAVAMTPTQVWMAEGFAGIKVINW